jgi:hypothetical protein
MNYKQCKSVSFDAAQDGEQSRTVNPCLISTVSIRVFFIMSDALSSDLPSFAS